MRSSADSRRATTAAASSRSLKSPWMPGSVLVRRSSASASGSGALGLAAGQLLLDPRRRLQRAEDDERAGGAPALPRLRLGLERRLQRAHDDRVLLAHAQQHQVQRQLEGQVLEEQREVEALVELDRDEDGLQRELAAVAAAAGELDRAGDPRRLAGVEELAPGLAGGRQRAADQRLEEALRRGSSSAGWSNSSSAGSDHLETEPWPSVRTK